MQLRNGTLPHSAPSLVHALAGEVVDAVQGLLEWLSCGALLQHFVQLHFAQHAGDDHVGQLRSAFRMINGSNLLLRASSLPPNSGDDGKPLVHDGVCNDARCQP